MPAACAPCDSSWLHSSRLPSVTWTGAVATAFLGRLNIVSVTFGILYVGLSVDHAIHICLRYREGILRNNLAHVGALRAAVQYVGGSLVIATLRTAVGFFSFVTTAHFGVSELGLIAGSGMFISLFANVTVLPAVLAPLPLRPANLPRKSARSQRLREFPVRHPRPVLVGSIMVAVAAESVVPEAAGTPIPMLGTSDIVVEAFSQAMCYAFVMSIVVLVVLMRSIRDVALALFLLVLAATVTGGVLALLDMPSNFANVIALPMLLGIGIDNGAHIVHRFREVPPGRAADINLLQTSTVRGVVLSMPTTTLPFAVWPARNMRVRPAWAHC